MNKVQELFDVYVKSLNNPEDSDETTWDHWQAYKTALRDANNEALKLTDDALDSYI